ncbi:MAG TPA: Gfo/Idh/MocA family oxidoreductase [Candidatus Limnocylindria bacterium]|nr:Gfo/Idh/MocA family oxidoreductase [Candidatus Limnocylindria bacterium]
MGSELLRAAVIGSGFVGPFHVDAVRRGGIGEVVIVAGSNRERTAAKAAGLGVRGTTNLDDIFDDATIDVVHVCTPNWSHVELATRALQAGKHVIVEKPLALTLEDARGLADLARQKQLHGLVAFTYRGYPMVRRARQLVADGELGGLRLVHGHYLQDWLSQETDYNWRLEPRAGASRAVADVGSHWFDTAQYITGSRITTVLADLATFLPVRQRPLQETEAFVEATGVREAVEIGSEDAATILVRFEDGARGAAVLSQVSPGRKNAFGLEIAGSDASLAWEQERPESLWIGTRDESRGLVRQPAPVRHGLQSLPSGHPEGWAEAMRDLLRDFYGAIVDGLPPAEAAEAGIYPTLDDGARAVALVEAVMESARTDAWATSA